MRTRWVKRFAWGLPTLVMMGIGGWAIRHPVQSHLLVLKFALRKERQLFQEVNAPLKAELKPLAQEISRRQANGQDVGCSKQIYREARWLVNFTLDATRSKERIDALRYSLAHPELEVRAHEQSAADGSWGGCFHEWFMRAWQTNESLGALKDDGVRPKHPYRFLDRVNSPEKLHAYLEDARETDFDKRGEQTRVRLDDSISGLGRMILRNRPEGYAFHPELRRAYLEFLRKWQDPDTGTWGVWFKLPWGTYKAPDTGITFHLLHHSGCEIGDMSKLGASMLELRNIDFPIGWKLDGHDENHLNMDAVWIFRCAWPMMTKSQRSQAGSEIRRELEWSLKETLNPDGSFKTSELDDTPGDAMENGVGFLRLVGYFDRSQRFWTDDEFPEADQVRKKILDRIRQVGTKDSGYRKAWDELTSSD